MTYMQTHIHVQVQEFTQVTMRDSIRQAIKKKKLHTKAWGMGERVSNHHWFIVFWGGGDVEEKQRL